jgi:hypothetical protein
MKKNLFIVFITLFQLFAIVLPAQNVAINADGSNADPSAMLDVKSTSKGMLVPRMTTAQRTAIVTPAAGLMVYDITTNGYWFYNGTAWTQMTTTGPWATSGNSISNTNPGSVTITGNNFEVNPQAFFNSNLDVDGSVDFGAGKFIFNNTTGNITTAGSISATGSITTSGAISATGNITTSGNLVVSGNRGIIRNSTSAQLKYYTREAAFSAILGPLGTSVEGSIGFAGGIFTSPPAVMVGDIVSTGGTVGQLYRVQLVVYDVTTTSCKVRLINTSDGPVNYNVTWNIICIGE